MMRARRLILTIALQLGIILTLAGNAISSPTRLIVKFRPGKDPGGLAARTALSSPHCLEARALFPKEIVGHALAGNGFTPALYWTVTAADSAQAAALTAELLASGEVEWAEPDYPLKLFGAPNDPLFPQQWFLRNTGQSYYSIKRVNGPENDSLVLGHGTPGADIGLVPARDKTAQKVRPLVAIIDTGIDKVHPDLLPNLWRNPGEIAGNRIDDDHNGFVDDILGWDFSGDTVQFFNLTGDPDVMDQHGHGTHVAGLACAVSNNALGVSGVASLPQVVGLKIFPNAFTSIAMRAIAYATYLGVDVINMSWGNFYPSRGLEEVLDYAHFRNVTLVAAIGNFGDTTRSYPAAFPVVIAVGATNSDDRVTYFSSYGDWIDLVSPGQDILSLRGAGLDMYAELEEPRVRIIDSMYYLADGTSMSSPIVTGVAAEVLSYAPGITTDSVERILKVSADDLVDPFGTGQQLVGFDRYSGWGRVDLKAALDLVGGRLAKINSPRPNALVDGALTVTGTAFLAGTGSYSLAIAPASDPSNFSTIATGSADRVSTLLGSWNGWTATGRYWLRLSVGQNTHTIPIVHAAQPVIEITSPSNQETVTSSLTLRGTVVAPGFRDYLVEIYPNLKPDLADTILRSTGYVVDSIIAQLSLQSFQEGAYTFAVVARSASDTQRAEVSLYVSNGFAQGFPRRGKGYLNYAPAVYDIDRNRRLETVVTSWRGIAAYNHIGGYAPGVWAIPDTVNMDAPAAVYDIDGDGFAEVAYVSGGELHLVGYDGYNRPGFPKGVSASKGQYGYAGCFFDDLDGDSVYELVYVSRDGLIYAFRSNGSSYFASLEGIFAKINSGDVTGVDAGETLPFVFCDDFNHDGQRELLVAMGNGIFLYDTHNGNKPAWVPSRMIGSLTGITGACMADFNGDRLLELAVVGRRTEDEAIYAAIMRPDGSFLNGFPKILNRANYLINFPVAADLDRDGRAELAFTISSIDNAEVYVIRADGSARVGPATPAGDEWLATFPGTAGPPGVFDINGDGNLEIVVRAGNFFPGVNTERVYAFDLDGLPTEGWPRTTFASPNSVFYRLHTPTFTNLGQGDDTLWADLLMTSDDSSIYAWKLPTRYDSRAVAWGQFAHDSRHSGILPIATDSIITAAEDPGAALPTGYALSQNYPNPFNLATTIEFELPRKAEVQVDLFNLLGQKVTTLAQGELPAGRHRLSWNGTDQSGRTVATGVYFYRLVTPSGVLTRKMMLLK